MPSKSRWRWADCVALLLCLAGCGGGGTDGPAPDGLPPTVVQFSPAYAPYDFMTGSQAAVFTDPGLTVGTDPTFPGQVVVFFRTDLPLEAASFFPGGDPALGIDQNALALHHRVAGTGLVLVPATLVVGPDYLAITPLGTYSPLQTGQYLIEVGSAGRDEAGLSVVPAPVLHTFFVNADADAPRVIVTSPESNAIDVPHGASSPDVLIRLDESILSSSVTGLTVEVFDDTAIVSTVQLPPAPGYPRLRVEDDGMTLPTNGHVVVWRGMGGFPADAILRVRVRGLGGVGSLQAIEDLNANEMLDDFTFRFFTVP